jgi:hypothetical protein
MGRFTIGTDHRAELEPRRVWWRFTDKEGFLHASNSKRNFCCRHKRRDYLATSFAERFGTAVAQSDLSERLVSREANIQAKGGSKMKVKTQAALISIVFAGVTLTVPVYGTTFAAERARSTDDGSRYSDRDRVKASKDSEDKLEQALKTGEEKAFYRRQLEKMGWKITSVNYDKPDYVEYEIVKGDDSYEVQIDFDKNSRKASKVDVALNVWKTDATERALKNQQERRVPKPHYHQSGTLQRS